MNMLTCKSNIFFRERVRILNKKSICFGNKNKMKNAEKNAEKRRFYCNKNYTFANCLIQKRNIINKLII